MKNKATNHESIEKDNNYDDKRNEDSHKLSLYNMVFITIMPVILKML